MIQNLIRKNRSTRRFKEDKAVPIGTLKWLVDLARLSPSAGNLQPLKYILSADKKKNDLIFPCLYWAGYLEDWEGPAKGQRPSAYIIILNDRQISKVPGCDNGIAAQTIMLGAAEKDISGCMIGSINRPKLASELNIPDQYEISLVLALGYADEEIVIEEVKDPNQIKYYRDPKGTHYVPKRNLDDIILEI